MDISIVIVNYRGWKALSECLDSLDEVESNKLKFEVIIVDNFSNDGIVFEFEKKYKKFNFYQNSGNNGFSNGCNFGASKSIGNYILFLNPDTIINTDALEVLLETAIFNPQIGILSCLQINESNRLYKQENFFPQFGRFFGLSRHLYRKLFVKELKIKFETKSNLFYPDWVTGAVIFMSSNWFHKIGGWNEDYWLYFEDVDFCKKVIDHGGKVAVTTEIMIIHKHGGASRINTVTKALTKTEVIISKHVYVFNHFSKIEQVIIHSFLLTSSLISSLFLAFLSLFLFFVPKLVVHKLIFKNLFNYYFNALRMRTWKSPRSMNYLKDKY